MTPPRVGGGKQIKFSDRPFTDDTDYDSGKIFNILETYIVLRCFHYIDPQMKPWTTAISIIPLSVRTFHFPYLSIIYNIFFNHADAQQSIADEIEINQSSGE